MQSEGHKHLIVSRAASVNFFAGQTAFVGQIIFNFGMDILVAELENKKFFGVLR